MLDQSSIDQSEKDLNRLTLVGWVVLISNGAACCMVVPFVLIHVCPELYIPNGRPIRGTLIVGFLLIGGAGFYSCKWLLEMVGVTVLRPPQGKCKKGDNDEARMTKE
jgi:hypothetical protein